MRISIGPMNFDVDMTATMEYSAEEAREHCTCGWCRNFYMALDGSYPQVRPFLAQFGVDAEAPDSMLPEPAGENRVAYAPEYTVFGNISPGVCVEIPVGQAHALLFPTGAGRFSVIVQGILLPWVLKEPMDTVKSPVNEAGIISEILKKKSN